MAFQKKPVTDICFPATSHPQASHHYVYVTSVLISGNLWKHVVSLGLVWACFSVEIHAVWLERLQNVILALSHSCLTCNPQSAGGFDDLSFLFLCVWHWRCIIIGVISCPRWVVFLKSLLLLDKTFHNYHVKRFLCWHLSMINIMMHVLKLNND